MWLWIFCKHNYSLTSIWMKDLFMSSSKRFQEKGFQTVWKSFWRAVKKWTSVLSYCSCGGEGLSEISGQRCSVSKTRGGLWQLEVPRVEQMLTKSITQDKEEGTSKAWVAFCWFLSPTFAESISLSGHDVAAESSDDGLRWLSFPWLHFQLFSHFQKPE